MDGIGGRFTAVLEKVKLPKKSSFWLILHKVVAAQIYREAFFRKLQKSH
jgi:hypothetical protein